MSEGERTACNTERCEGTLAPGDRFCSACGQAADAKQWADKGLAAPRRKVKIGGGIGGAGLLVAWVSFLQLPEQSVLSVIGDILSGGGPDVSGAIAWVLLFLVGAFAAAFGAMVVACGAVQGGFRVASGERVGAKIADASKVAREQGKAARERAPEVQKQVQVQFQQQVTRAKPLAKDAGARAKDAGGRAKDVAGARAKDAGRAVGPQLAKAKERARRLREGS